MVKKIRWGIMGCGHIARKFAEDIAQMPQAEVYACASRSADRAHQFAKKHSAKIAFDNYKELAKCTDVDAVYIATHHVHHHDHTIMCLENLMPVLCEKPFAMNSRQVRNMIRIANRYDTYLMEALWTRFLPQTQKVLTIIHSDKIGVVQNIQADFGFKIKYDPSSRLLNRELGGGSILDIGIYPIFLALLILGMPDDINATATIGKTQVDESAAISFVYKDNKKAKLYSTFLKQSPTEAYIYGSKGHIHIHGRWHEPSSLSVHLHGQSPQVFNYKTNTWGYNYEAEAVMQDLQNNRKQNQLMPHHFSMQLMNVLDEVRQQVGMKYPNFDV